MRPVDVVRFSWQVLSRHRFRSAMVLLAMAVSVASVVLLTALGEGARRYVMAEFAFLGKDLLIVFPGRKETTGGMPPVTGSVARDITLEDTYHLRRRIAAIEQIAPLVLGSVEVSYRGRSREVLALGSSDALLALRQLALSAGRNIAPEDRQRYRDECIVGQKVVDELFGAQAAIGARLRVGDYRCRVVGVLAGRGDAIGMDLSDAIIMPVSSAMRLFNTPGLFRVMIGIKPGHDVDRTRQRIEEVMQDRHQGEEDVTVVSPDALLSTFDQVLLAMTLGLGAIAGISLLVAGVLIMNVTLIGVSQRTEEIGLLKALGASSTDVQILFLTEALLTTLTGAVAGLLWAGLLIQLGRRLLPAVPFEPPWWSVAAALGVAMLCGLLFAWMPARRASELRPVQALQRR